VHRSICADTSGRRGRVPAQMDMMMVQGAVEDAPARVRGLTEHTRRADHGGYLRMVTALVWRRRQPTVHTDEDEKKRLT
jgi:hypothetical protein